ncbi:hypothetical protein BST61_g5457 [Cercospora zeina]
MAAGPPAQGGLRPVESSPAGAISKHSVGYHGDAARKVFAIPELLEQILCVAVVSQHARDRELNELYMLKMWPMPGCGNVSKGGICLFRIQRVNKTFRNTIQGSAKLKQLIYLAPRDNAELIREAHLREGRLILHKPLYCLIGLFDSKVDDGTIGLLDLNDSEFIDEVATMKFGLNNTLALGEATPYDRIIGTLPKGWHNPEASWANIKICNAKIPTSVQLIVEHDESWECDALPVNTVTWELDRNETLEHVFDLLAELLDAINSHRKGKQAMEEDRTAMSKRFKQTANRKRRALEAELENEEQEQLNQHYQRGAELAK